MDKKGEVDEDTGEDKNLKNSTGLEKKKIDSLLHHRFNTTGTN